MDSRAAGGQYQFIAAEWKYLVSLPEEELGAKLSDENQNLCLSVINHLSSNIELHNQDNQLVKEAAKIVRCLPEEYSNDPRVLKVINHLSTHGGFFVEKGWIGANIGSLFGYSKYAADQQLVDKIRLSIEQGKGDMALALLDSEFPLSDTQKKEFLLLACERGETKVAEKLIQQLQKVLCFSHEETHLTASGEERAGAPMVFDIDFTGADFDETPLHVACRCGHTDIAMMLIKAGADVNIADSYGETPLFNAFDAGLEKVVFALIQNGAILQQENHVGESLVLVVAERLLASLEEDHSLTNEMDKRLMLLLIEQGVDAREFVQDKRFEAVFGDILGECIVNGSTRLSTALVGNGISVKDEHLLMACRKGNEKLALELLKRSNQGGINFVDQQGNTSLHWACNQGLGTLAMELIKQGASIDAVNKKGDTPIQEAIRNEVGSVIEYATNQGVDVSSLRWETELKDISQLSAGLAKRMAEELGSKSKDSVEAATVFKLSKQLNELRKQNAVMPPYLRISEEVFIKILEKEVVSIQKQVFFQQLDKSIDLVMAKMRSNQFEALKLLAEEIGGKQFGSDTEKFCLNPDSQGNQLFAAGFVSITEHPFVLASIGDKIKMVLLAKAKTTEMNQSLSLKILSRADAALSESKLSVEEFYRRADSVFNLCNELFGAQNLLDKSSLLFKSLLKEGEGAGFYQTVVSSAVDKWGPTLIMECSKQDPIVWLKPLAALMRLAGGLNSDDIEFDSRVISEVIVKLAYEHGFPEDVEKFQKLFEDPVVREYLMQLCIKEAASDKFQNGNMLLWKRKFEEAGKDIHSIDIFSKQFEPHFQGAVHSKVLSVLLKAASAGSKYAIVLDVPPEVLAQGLALYYQQKGSVQGVPDLEELVPFCDAMPPLKDWASVIRGECGNSISPIATDQFCALLKAKEMLPRTVKEAEVLSNAFTVGMSLLQEGGYSQSSEAVEQVALGCILLIKKQRRLKKPLAMPEKEAVLASFRSKLPEIEGWHQLLEGSKPGQLVLHQMRLQGMRGPVSQLELKMLTIYPGLIQNLILRGYSEGAAACAIARYVGYRFAANLPLEAPIPDKTLFRFCFEACIESAIAHESRDKIEDTIALFNCMKGREIALTKDGQRRLAFLARKVCSPDFAEGRAPGQFRVVEKFPQIMSAIGINNVKKINHLPFDETLLGDLFDEQTHHVFKNLNVKELLHAITLNPEQAIASLLIPALTVLAGDNSPEFKNSILKLIPLITSQKEFKDNFEVFKSLLGKLEMANAVEADLEISTPDVISGLLGGILGMKEQESQSLRLGQEQQEAELALIRQLFRMIGGVIFDKDKGEGEGMGGTGKFMLKMTLSAVAGTQSKLTSVVGSSAIKYGASATSFALGKWGSLKSWVTSDESSRIDPQLLEATPAIVDVIQKVVVNLSNRIPIAEKQELLNYWINLETEEAIDQRMQAKEASKAESNLLKRKKKEELLMKLYETAEELLTDCQNTLPGLFEGVLNGVKSIPKSQLQPGLAVNAVLLEEGEVVQKSEVTKQRQIAFQASMTKLFEGTLYTTDEDKFIIKNIIPFLTSEMEGILQKRTLTGDELAQMKSLVKIGYTLCGTGKYSPKEVAIACCRYCDEMVKEGKPIKAPEYLLLIEDKERRALLPFAFDAAVELLSNEILKDSVRPDFTANQPEGHLKQKILFYLNHGCIQGCSTPLTPQGRESLNALIRAMLNPDFCSGKNLLDPLVVERFPLILKGAKLSSVQSLNLANPQHILKGMIVESEVCMKKINVGTLLQVVKQNPKELMCTLSNPVLGVLMEGASFEEQQRAEMFARSLLTTFNDTHTAKDLIKKMEAQLGKFDFKGIGLELSISLSQLAGGLNKDLQLLSKDIESGALPKVEEAERYGLLAPQLVKFAAHVSKVQKERRKPLEARDKELSESLLMGALDAAKPYAGFVSSERGVQEEKGALGQLKKGLVSSISETAKYIATGESVIKWIVEKVIESKIEGAIKGLKEEAMKGDLTEEQQDQLKFYTALAQNLKPLVEVVSNVAVKALNRHDLSLHTGLFGYLGALSDNPQMEVDEKKLTEHVIVSVEALFSEIDLYGDLIPGILAALASSQKLAS